jgi:flagellar hook protein FlgE
MSSALWAGISGLNASTKELDVIANNLANVNTIGYKSGTTFFADVLSQSLSGGSSGTLQVGRGVAVAEIQTQFSTGSFENTNNATDVAIDGDGFFMVNDKNNATFYTRAGAFHLNAAGLLVDLNGNTLQGQLIVNNVPTGPITDINLQGVQSAPAPTTTFALGANLNSDSVTGGQYSTSQTVYDSLGNTHTLNNVFTKTENATAGYWSVQTSLDSTPATAQSANGVIFDADGNLTQIYTGTVGAVTVVGAGTATVALDRPGMVYKTGTLTLTRGAAGWSVTGLGGYANAAVTSAGVAGPVTVSLDGTGTTDITLTPAGVWAATNTATFTVTNTPSALTDITINLSGIPLAGGATIGAGGIVNWNLVGADSLPVTQYASPSVINSLTSDGYASGQLKTLSIGSDGKISGLFTNGQTTGLAQIFLASFPNPWGLSKMGNNLFAATINSGASIRNTPGNSGMGSLSPNTLEMANTDIATEFIKMITAQKAYQANARTVTSQDTIMQELMNIMR